MKLRYAALWICLAALAIVIAIFPEKFVPACFEGVALWAKCVVPALFPFMIITMLFVATGGAAKVSAPFLKICTRLKLPAATAVIFIMSVFSGYPAGCRILSEFYKRGEITKRDTALLAPLCSTSGPLFLVGSGGYNMLGDKGAGWLLLAAHITSVFSVWAVTCLFYKREPQNALLPVCGKRDNILYETFLGGVTSVLVAGGFICFFYTVACAAEEFNLLYPLTALLTPLFGGGAQAFAGGLIEATGGCAKLIAANCPLALPLSGFLVTFGGASIIAQQMCYLSPCGVSAKKFVLIKFVQALLCFALLYLIAP